MCAGKSDVCTLSDGISPSRAHRGCLLRDARSVFSLTNLRLSLMQDIVPTCRREGALGVA